MRIAATVQDSIVDGPGLRYVVFTQGCQHGCKGCHNPETHNPDGGRDVTAEELIRQMRANPLTDGLTLSGGEPFLQAGDRAKIAEAAKRSGLNVWVYSGYTFEELLKLSQSNPEIASLINTIDVLVDGRFVLAERSLNLRWRGSRNQRILDVPKSLAAGTVAEYSPN